MYFLKLSFTHPKLNFNVDPKLPNPDVAVLVMGIVSDRCMLLLSCVESSNVAERCPLNKMG